MPVEFYMHHLTEDDIRNTAQVLRSVFLTTGPVTAEFETRFSKFTGLSHSVALSSCTAALHLALLSLDIGPGDEVITTPMTFIATATAILHVGARPVFVDIDPETGLMDPERVEQAITPRTKAILPVHLYGTMADMKALRDLADRKGLYIIEDTAHCIEGERDGIRPGELSDAACFSFYATKNLTCGEGGALATNRGDVADRVRRLRQHGMNKEAADRYHGAYRHWDMVDLGWKYNMDDIHAALLVDQIGRLSALWEQRHRLFASYRDGLSGIEQIRQPAIMGKSAYHLLVILAPAESRDRLLTALNAEGIGVAVNYRAIHTLTWFRERFGFAAEDYPQAYLFGQRTVSLPFYTKLSLADVDTVVTAIRRFFE